MLMRSELPENPVALAVADRDGFHQIVTERLKGGRIRMSCTCATSRAEGWCLHRVRLLCLRYDDVVAGGDDDEFRFEDIVMGTALADSADEVEMALDGFERARKTVGESHGLGGLAILARDASSLADSAYELDRALARLKTRLAGGG